MPACPIDLVCSTSPAVVKGSHPGPAHQACPSTLLAGICSVSNKSCPLHPPSASTPEGLPRSACGLLLTEIDSTDPKRRAAQVNGSEGSNLDEGLRWEVGGQTFERTTAKTQARALFKMLGLRLPYNHKPLSSRNAQQRDQVEGPFPLKLGSK